MNVLNVLQTFWGGLIGGGLIGFIQFLINRHDERNDRNEEILIAISQLDEKINLLEQKIDEVDQKGEQREAAETRMRILRFDDELREKRQHSLEHFQQIMRDIDGYLDYCSEHPKYKNTYAEDAIQNIREVFRDCKDKNSFI